MSSDINSKNGNCYLFNKKKKKNIYAISKVFRVFTSDYILICLSEIQLSVVNDFHTITVQENWLPPFSHIHTLHHVSSARTSHVCPALSSTRQKVERVTGIVSLGNLLFGTCTHVRFYGMRLGTYACLRCSCHCFDAGK